MGWYVRKSDGMLVFKKGRYKVLEIWKRPHGKYACVVYDKKKVVSSQGYFGTYLTSKIYAKVWGFAKAKELNII